MARNLRILMAQVAIPEMSNKQQQQAHVTRLIERLDEHLSQAEGIDLVLLPELACMQYSTENFRCIDEFAEPLGGGICAQFANLCRRYQVAVCFGMARQEAGAYFISQVVLDKRGEYLTHYDKVHTAEYGDSSEGRFFLRGDHLSCFELAGVKFGLAICYDLRFAELFQRYARECEVDVMLHPVAFARDMTFATWHPFVITRALENQVYFISLNQAGDYFGDSIVCPPWVDDSHQPMVLGREQSFVVVEIDRQELQRVRAAIPYAQDTLADYSKLLIQ
jgi:nitrilase